MNKIVNAAQMRAMDSRTIDQIGVPGVVLMENAGRGVVDVIRRQIPDLAKVRVNIFCGKGNNGGDGYVVARHLFNLGAEPTVFLAGEQGEISGDAKVNLDAFIAMGGRVKSLTEDRQLKNFKLKFMHTRVVVDALLGSGVTGAPRGFYADIIDVMNRQGTLTVAIDIPTGVNADTGAIEGAHVKADITVTFGVKKVGLTTYPGKAVCGEIVVAEISIPPVVLDQSPCVAYEPTPADIVKMLPARLENGHKGTFGHSVIIGGSTGMGGAVLMAALGSLRIGGGLVSAAVPVPLTSSFEAGALEVMAYPLPFNDFGTITAPAAESALAFAVDKEVIAIGPGLRVNDDTKAFVRTIIEKFNKPIIIDADGLNGLDDEAASLIATRTAPTVVTPHPGELSRMTGASVETIERDRIGAAKHFAAASGAVVVLKGAATVIATPTGEAFINPTGNHGLATGGTGDILTGMIAGLIAQGASATDAAIAAVYIHGAAADQYVAEGNDPRTLLATDLLSIIPFLLNDLAE